MMINWNLAFLSMVFLTLNQACDSYNSFELDLDYKGNKLVIDGFFNVDSINILVSRSTSIVDTFKYSDLKLSNPKVVIREKDGPFLLELTSQNGFTFKAKNVGLKVGKAYQVQASADNIASAETDWIVIPELITLDSFQTEPYRRNDVIGHVLQFNIKDPAEENFYFINFRATLDGLKSKNSTQGWPFDEQINGNCYNGGSFSDQCFNGKKLTLKYVVKTHQSFKPRDNNGEQGNGLIIRFANLSKQAHLGRNQGSGDDIIEGLNEPAPTYTNVKNGYGLVFAFNSRDYVIKLQ
jgi:hypothetical protein